MTTYVPAHADRTPAQQEYARYLRSPRWRLLRWLRRRIDGGRCTHPGCTARTRLEVHHVRYDNRGRGFWAELRDLRTLCSAHHGAAHGRGG